jgi:hypothetical protein
MLFRVGKQLRTLILGTLVLVSHKSVNKVLQILVMNDITFVTTLGAVRTLREACAADKIKAVIALLGIVR